MHHVKLPRINPSIRPPLLKGAGFQQNPGFPAWLSNSKVHLYIWVEFEDILKLQSNWLQGIFLRQGDYLIKTTFFDRGVVRFLCNSTCLDIVFWSHFMVSWHRVCRQLRGRTFPKKNADPTKHLHFGTVLFSFLQLVKKYYQKMIRSFCLIGKAPKELSEIINKNGWLFQWHYRVWDAPKTIIST